MLKNTETAKGTEMTDQNCKNSHCVIKNHLRPGGPGRETDHQDKRGNRWEPAR